MSNVANTLLLLTCLKNPKSIRGKRIGKEKNPKSNLGLDIMGLKSFILI